MTDEEKHLISECRVMIIGSRRFIEYVLPEMTKLGFRDVHINHGGNCFPEQSSVNIMAEYGGNGSSCLKTIDNVAVPLIYPFDFVNGAGAMVVMSGDDRELLGKSDLRVWAAEYMAGYCAFWNVPDCDWLQQSHPAIRNGDTSESAQKTAAHICARIAANIAVGREVKHFPRFYLCRNLE